MLVFTIAILVALLAAGGVSAYAFLTKDDPVVYSNLVLQYKYGSVGTEERQGVPYETWVVLPEVFPDLLPKTPGKGWEKLGFIYEKGHVTRSGRPTATSRSASSGSTARSATSAPTATSRERPSTSSWACRPTG